MIPVYAGPKTEPELNRLVGDFVSTLIWGEPGQFENFATMGVFDNGVLVGGVVYHNWIESYGVIELTAASTTKRWVSRPIIEAMATMPFVVWGCQLCILRVSERNTGMLRIARKYGFSEYVIPRMRGRDEAEHIFTLTDDDWRSGRFRELVRQRLRARKEN